MAKGKERPKVVRINTSTSSKARLARTEKANQLIQKFVDAGSRAFSNIQGEVSMFRDEKSKSTCRLYFYHAHGNNIYYFPVPTAYRELNRRYQDLVVALATYIQTAEPLSALILGPWPRRIFGGNLFDIPTQQLHKIRNFAYRNHMYLYPDQTYESDQGWNSFRLNSKKRKKAKKKRRKPIDSTRR